MHTFNFQKKSLTLNDFRAKLRDHPDSVELLIKEERGEDLANCDVIRCQVAKMAVILDDKRLLRRGGDDSFLSDLLEIGFSTRKSFFLSEQIRVISILEQAIIYGYLETIYFILDYLRKNNELRKEFVADLFQSCQKRLPVFIYLVRKFHSHKNNSDDDNNKAIALHDYLIDKLQVKGLSNYFVDQHKRLNQHLFLLSAFLHDIDSLTHYYYQCHMLSAFAFERALTLDVLDYESDHWSLASNAKIVRQSNSKKSKIIKRSGLIVWEKPKSDSAHMILQAITYCLMGPLTKTKKLEECLSYLKKAIAVQDKLNSYAGSILHAMTDNTRTLDDYQAKRSCRAGYENLSTYLTRLQIIKKLFDKPSDAHRDEIREQLAINFSKNLKAYIQDQSRHSVDDSATLDEIFAIMRSMNVEFSEVKNAQQLFLSALDAGLAHLLSQLLSSNIIPERTLIEMFNQSRDVKENGRYVHLTLIADVFNSKKVPGDKRLHLLVTIINKLRECHENYPKYCPEVKYYLNTRISGVFEYSTRNQLLLAACRYATQAEEVQYLLKNGAVITPKAFGGVLDFLASGGFTVSHLSRHVNECNADSEKYIRTKLDDCLDAILKNERLIENKKVFSNTLNHLLGKVANFSHDEIATHIQEKIINIMIMNKNIHLLPDVMKHCTDSETLIIKTCKQDLKKASRFLDALENIFDDEGILTGGMVDEWFEASNKFQTVLANAQIAQSLRNQIQGGEHDDNDVEEDSSNYSDDSQSEDMLISDKENIFKEKISTASQRVSEVSATLLHNADAQVRKLRKARRRLLHRDQSPDIGTPLLPQKKSLVSYDSFK